MTATIHAHPRLLERRAEQQERRRMRDDMAAIVELLIGAMDELDDDPDLEPWLGAPERMAGDWNPRATGGSDDREEDDDSEAVNEDGDELDAGEQDDAEAAERSGLADSGSD